MRYSNNIENFILNEFRLKNTLLLSVFINIIIFSIFFISVTPAADENDDIFMMMISSGALSGDPSEFLLFMNVALGNILKSLYTQIPSINWYIIFLYFYHFLSMTILLYVFLKLKNNFFSIILFIILFVFFELHLLIRVQFTSTGFILGFIGVLLFLLSLTDKVKNKLSVMFFALMIIVLATLIRFSVLYGIMMMVIPIFALKFVNTRCIRIPLFIGILFIISFGILKLENNYYVMKLGKPNILEYLKAIDVLASHPLNVTEEYLKEVNWSLNDITLIREWFWMDKDIHSHDKVVKFSNIAKSHNDLQTILKQCYVNITLKGKRYVFLGIFCILSSILLIPKKETKYVIVSLLTLIITYCFLLYYFRAPHRGLLRDRVFLPLMFFVYFFCFYLILEFFQYDKVKKNLKPHLVFLLLILFSFQIYKIAIESRTNKKNHCEFYQAIEDINSVKDSLFLVSGSNYYFPHTSMPLFRNPKEYSAFNIIPIGWVAHTPSYNKVLEHFQIKDLPQALYEKNKVYLISGNKIFYDSLIIFYKEHKNLTININSVEINFKYLKPRQVRIASGHS